MRVRGGAGKRTQNEGAGRKSEGVRTSTTIAAVCSDERCLLLEEAQIPDLQLAVVTARDK